jgi:hypothetical protein
MSSDSSVGRRSLFRTGHDGPPLPADELRLRESAFWRARWIAWVSSLRSATLGMTSSGSRKGRKSRETFMVKPT